MTNRGIGSTLRASTSSISTTKKRSKISRDDRSGSGSDVDSVTEKSTVASVSSDDDDDSFGPDITLSSLGQAVVGKFKVSARGLAQTSGARISPLIQRGNSAMVFKPRPKRVRAPLTLQQLQARKRRSDKLARISRMLQRVNQDPFVASRTILALAAILLVVRAGRGHVASCLSLIGTIILHQTTKLTSTSYLRSWYYLSSATVLVCVSSWIWTQLLLGNYFNLMSKAAESAVMHRQYWVCTHVMPRLWGLFLAFWVYRDVMTSNDAGDVHAIDTIYIKASLVGIKIHPHAPGAATRRHQWKNSTIVVHHGPVLVGEAPTKKFLDEKANESKFRTTAFSHFLESVEGSSLKIRLQHGDDIMATASVPIPTIRNIKMSDWFPFMNSDEKVGELLVQIQSRPMVVPFLFRASTVIPIMVCTGLAVFVWR